MNISRRAQSFGSVATAIRAAIPVAALLFLVGIAPSQAATAASASTVQDAAAADLWYGIFLMSQPIGGSHQVSSVASFEGRRCLMTIETSRTNLTLLGVSVNQDVDSTDYSDLKTKLPVYEKVVLSSAGRTTTVTARFTARKVTAVLESGGSSETHVLTVPDDAELLADDPTMSPPTPKGKKMVYFDPASLSLQEVSVAAAPGESKLHPKKLIVSMETGDVTVTQDDQGIPIRMDMPAGISMVRGTAEKVASFMGGSHAVSPEGLGSQQAEQGAPDFAVVTSVEPTGQPLLPAPSLVVATVTQKGRAPQDLTERAVPEPAAGDADATVDSVRGRSDLAPDLSNTAYLSLDNEQIKHQAEIIADGRTNLFDIAVQIERWVHEQMTPTPAIGLPRSAVEILGDRKGVCRDYAMLYTALARSAGVPTRLCAGLVGFRGRLYYHAWAESYIGGSIGWMPFDPTLFEHPVDASHIALVKGDPANLYDLVGRIGEIQVNILKCER